MQSEVPYFPFGAETVKPGEVSKPSMGLRPLDLKKWIEIDSTFEAQVSKKSDILKNNQDLVLKITPPATEAILETQNLLKNHLLEVFPDFYSFKNNEFHVQKTKQTYTISEDPKKALLNISQWAQEDFCFMSPEVPSKLAGGCVCFPSRWNLPQKMSLDSDGIHGPVPKFKESIAKATATFLEKIQVEKPMWRLNWTLHDCPEIFTPFPEEGRSDLTKENVIDNTYVRMERQTLRRLPLSQFVLFTIRTYVVPVQTIAQDSIKREALKSTLMTLPEDTASYKGMRKFFDILKEAL